MMNDLRDQWTYLSSIWPYLAACGLVWPGQVLAHVLHMDTEIRSFVIISWQRQR